MEETKACPCDEFLSQPYGNWSACILPNPLVFESLQGWMVHREVKECGRGVRYRAVACIDQRGHLVNPTFCTDTGKTMPFRYPVVVEQNKQECAKVKTSSVEKESCCIFLGVLFFCLILKE